MGGFEVVHIEGAAFVRVRPCDTRLMVDLASGDGLLLDRPAIRLLHAALQNVEEREAIARLRRDRLVDHPDLAGLAERG